MALAYYVVRDSDYDELAGPTGYEKAHAWYGPLATVEEARELADGSMEDQAVVVEMDRGDDAPEPFDRPDPERAGVLAREALDRRVAELARFWALVTADRRDAVDAECGGLVPALDAVRDAARDVAGLER